MERGVMMRILFDCDTTDGRHDVYVFDPETGALESIGWATCSMVRLLIGEIDE